ncbi:50S ribosomal protein L4 [bacterium]|nr:50S ribosomal protein L4 [bacterium]
MPKVDLFDKTKTKIGEVELSDRVFNVESTGKENVLVSEVVKMQLAAVRQGTHATKTYATISGGNSKPWKQKGTGRARRGTMRSSTLRGGAPAFGPQPRSYGYNVPLRKRTAAVAAVLSDRLRSGNLFVIKNFDFDKIKTKDAVALLKGTWNFSEAVIIAGDNEENFYFSMRNLPEFSFLPQDVINLYDLIAYKNVVFTEDSVKYVDELLQNRLNPRRTRVSETTDGE